MDVLFAELWYADTHVRFNGINGPSGDGLIVDVAGVEGWYSSPEVKTELTERATGNGAHDVPPDSISYAARVVTLHFDAIGGQREQVLAAINRASLSAGLPVRLRVCDGLSDTFVTGFVRPEHEATWSSVKSAGTLTVTCPRPERLSWSARESQLFPVAQQQGGLAYSNTTAPISLLNPGFEDGLDHWTVTGSGVAAQTSVEDDGSTTLTLDDGSEES